MDELREQGLGLAAISYDAPEALAAFAELQGIRFPLLSDVGSETIREYGILNTVAMELLGPNADSPELAEDLRTYVSVVNPRAQMAGIAFPGTFMLDTDGRVTSRFFEDFYITRNTVAGIMARLDSGQSVAGTQISSGQLDLVTYPSDAAVAPGNLFALNVEIAPHDGMHVYAPGASSYRVVSVEIDPQPFVTVLPIEYPESETYYFEPFDERVPVYQQSFTLVQQLVLEGTPEAQTALRGQEAVTLTGRLEYQACDDRICYNPESVPLSWTLALRPIEFGRRPPPPQ